MRWCWLACVVCSGSAMAQDVDSSTDSATAATASSDSPQLGVNLRFRSMSIPSSILDTWYFDSDDAGARPLDRPKVGANVYGVEFAVEPAPASFLFYAEYWKVRMEEGYWDDREDEPVDHNDGSWLQPSKLGMVAFGANVGHEVPLSNDDANNWVGLRFGGGLGLAIPTGTINRWNAGANWTSDPSNGCAPDEFAPTRATTTACDPDEVLELWPVFPVLDIDVALRMHISDVALIRIDAGMHDMFYVGTAVGATF